MMDYKAIIGQLQSLKEHCKDWADKEEEDNIWNRDVQALNEAMDIIYDYGEAAEQAKRLIAKYETVKDAIERGMGSWQCPNCQKFISFGNEHCHWCGQRLGWETNITKSQPKRRKRK